MASGVPVVASNVGGVKDIIEDNVNGFLINPNIDELFRLLKKLYTDEETRERARLNGIQCSKKFTASFMASEYIEIYK